MIFLIVPLVLSLKPVVLFPGLSGTALEATLNKKKSPAPFYCDRKADTFRIWLSLSQLSQPLVNCFLENMMLHFDPKTGLFNNTKGVEIDPIDWEGVKGFDYLDYIDGYPVPISQYMNPLIELLQKNGYKVGESLFGAPYDWRYSADYYHTKLIPNNHLFQTLIEKAFENAKNEGQNEKVILIAHSMGNAHLSWFLNTMVSKEWKERYIDRYIVISNPQAGAPGILRSVLSGCNDQFTLGWFSLISNQNTRSLYRSWPSFMSLLPHEHSVYEDDVIVTIKSSESTRFFNVSRVRDLLELTGDKNLPIMFDLEKEMRNTALKDPEVPVYCMYSDLGPNSTEYSYVYNVDDLGELSPSSLDNIEMTKVENDVFGKQPTRTMRSGDGSVPIESLSHCTTWKSTVQVKVVQGVQHEHTVQDGNAVKTIWELMNYS